MASYRQQDEHLASGLKRSGMPPGGSDVGQIKGLETCVFGSVAMAGLTSEFSEVWQSKGLANSRQGIGVRPGKESRDRRDCISINTRNCGIKRKCVSSNYMGIIRIGTVRR